jgi:hypothetical protein
MDSVAARANAHAEVAAALAEMDDARLGSLVLTAQEARSGWGTSHAVDVAGRRVFVKRLPLTDVEVDAGPTTRNLFGLPVFYSYGVGSAGFGAYREVAAHDIASRLVLRGITPGFPILHHQRPMPRTEPGQGFRGDLAAYVARWGGNEAIGTYIEARASAAHELWTFSEFVPDMVGNWLRVNQSRSSDMLSALRAAVTALNDAGVVHFDTHFANSLTDGTTFLLADFGLALCSSFELDDEERAFLAAHQHYDHALLVCSVGMAIARMVFDLDEDARTRVVDVVGVRPGEKRASMTKPVTALELARAVCDQASVLREAGLLDLDPALVGLARRYGPPITAMGDFFDEISRPDKVARFDDAFLARLLAEADGS